MGTITQTLESQILWQTPIKLIVKVAFYAFAVKLFAIVARKILLVAIGTRRWLMDYGANDLAPYMPGDTKIGKSLKDMANDKYRRDRISGKIPEGTPRRKNIWALLLGGLTIAHAWLAKND